LFYFAVICAALIALRYKQPDASRLRVPAGSFLAVMGILIALALTTQVDLSKSLIMAATMAAAVLNWAWARRADRAKL
jgi:amino acid transporter